MKCYLDSGIVETTLFYLLIQIWDFQVKCYRQSRQGVRYYVWKLFQSISSRRTLKKLQILTTNQ